MPMLVNERTCERTYRGHRVYGRVLVGLVSACASVSSVILRDRSNAAHSTPDDEFRLRMTDYVKWRAALESFAQRTDALAADEALRGGLDRPPPPTPSRAAPLLPRGLHMIVAMSQLSPLLSHIHVCNE